MLEGEARVTDPTPMSNSLRDLLGLGGGAEELIEFIHDRYDLGVTDTGDPYGVPKGGPNIVRLLHGGRPSFRSEVALAYWQKEQMVPKSTDLSSALMIIEGECHQCPPVTPALRAGRNQADGRLILDLGNEVGEAVTIDFQGWHVGPSPVLLRRTEATMPLPTPVAGSNLNQLRSFLTIGDKDWPLMVAWLVSALIPDMPHPVLFLQGTQGAAKTSSLEVVTALIDPSASQTRTAPRGLKDWIIGAAGSWTIGLDNISEIPPWLSDSLCQAVTGTGFYRRKLRTDSDVSVLAFRRVIAITSIDVGHIAGDLADRMLRIDLDRIPDSQRIDEGLLDAEWRRLHPAILGGLLDTVVAVLVRLPLIRHRDLPRMADFARVLIAVDGVLRTRGYRRYMEMIKSVDQLAVDSDIVAGPSLSG